MNEIPENPNGENFGEAIRPKPRLRALTAIAAFLLFMGAQVFFAVVMTIVWVISNMISGDTMDAAGIEAGVQKIMPMIVIVSFAGGAIGLLIAAWIVKPSLRDTSFLGAAWSVGDPKKILKCLGLGVVVALVYLIIPLLVIVPDENMEAGPLSKMLMQPGMGRVVMIFIALFLAPPMEELLFRGIMLGGFNYSFGVKWGGALIVFLFAIIHAGEAIHYWPALFGIALMAATATWARLTYRAIGPAIAVHFGYNAVVVVISLLPF